MTPTLARLARAATLALLLPATPVLLADSTISDDPSTMSDCCYLSFLKCAQRCWASGGDLTGGNCRDLSPTTCAGWTECPGDTPSRCTFGI
jgi:hypothetical protein